MAIQHINEAIEIVKEITALLERYGVNYWICRGLLRHFMVTGAFGEIQSDIDFHIWATEQDKLLQMRDKLATLGYQVLNRQNYKIAFYKMVDSERIEIEFVFLFINERNNEKTWHQSRGNMFCCPTDVFNNAESKDFYGTQVRVPSPPEKYLEEVYGSNWRSEIN